MSDQKVVKLLKEKFDMTIVKVTPLAGLSNQVFKVKTDDGQKYVFKILSYNPNEVFRRFERHALKKSKASELLIHNDKHHRLERFIKNEDVKRETFMQEPMCLYQMYCLARFNQSSSVESSRPNLFYLVESSKEQLRKILDKSIEGIKDEAMRGLIKQKLAVVDRVYEYYRTKCETETLVLSHNDCYYRNYLYSIQERQMFLIDYEYAGYNPLGMDVLVLYQEYLCNYETEKPPGKDVLYNDFPNDAQFRRLLHYYLYFYKNMDNLADLKHDETFVKTVESDPKFKEVSDGEIEAILKRFGFFGVLCQVFFFYWALYLPSIEDVDFDYHRFALIKYELLGFFLKRDGNDIREFEKEADTNK